MAKKKTAIQNWLAVRDIENLYIHAPHLLILVAVNFFIKRVKEQLASLHMSWESPKGTVQRNLRWV
jgi:hypothetical protein